MQIETNLNNLPADLNFKNIEKMITIERASYSPIERWNICGKSAKAALRSLALDSDWESGLNR